MENQSMKVVLVLSILVLLAMGCTPATVVSGTPDPIDTNPPLPTAWPTLEPGTDQPVPTSEATLQPTDVQPAGPPADVIFYNGVILTMLDSPDPVEALAIIGDRIVAMGSAAEILTMTNDSTIMIDLEGRTLMPGFVDPHTHLFNDAGRMDTDLAGAQQLALSNGITTLANMFSPQDFVEEMRAFDEAGELIVRTSLYLTMTDNCGGLTGDWWMEYPPTRESGELLRIGGLKAFADGGTCGPIAISEPYAVGYEAGPLYFTQEGMNDLFSLADQNGYQLAVHAIGDLAVEQVLNAVGTVNSDGLNPLRHRIEHNSLVPTAIRPLYAEYDVVATLFGYHRICDYTDYTPFFQEIGEDLRGMLDDNPDVHFAWHGDDPWIGPISPLLEMASMVTRVEPDGVGGYCEPPAWMAAKAISVEEVLRMMTTEAAYALFREEEVGSLAPGLYADLIILSGDPTSVDPMDLWDLEVLATMVGGEFVYCADQQNPWCESQE
jgi:predicted amidohydrolase YtcJ